MPKHLIIKDADEDIEYDVEEIAEADEPTPVEEKTEAVEEHEEVCPECGKEPCECKPAEEKAVFTEEEIAALKELVSIVPELKKLLEAKPEEKPEEKSEEHEEIKEIEEVKEDEDFENDENIDEEAEEDLTDSVADSVGSIEHTVGDAVSDESSNETVMAERFKKYYGGN